MAKKRKSKAERRSQIEVAFHESDLAKVKELLQDAENTKLMREYLCSACSLQDVKVIRALLEAEADPNMATYGGRPLQYAVRAKSPAMVQLLLDHGALVNLGTTISNPYNDAIDADQPECACLLLQHGVDFAADECSQTALVKTIQKGFADVIAAYLENGGDPNQRGSYAETRMHDSGEVVRTQHYSEAPLVHMAAGEGQLGILELLLDAKADPLLADAAGLTAYQVALAKNQSITAAKLEEVGGDAAPKLSPDEQLLLASQAGDVANAQESLAAGANASAIDQRTDFAGATPLTHAAQTGNCELLEMLLAAGADVQVSDVESDRKQKARSLAFLYENAGLEEAESMMLLGRTPLIHAAANGHADAVRLLVAANADVDTIDLLKISALWAACQVGDEEIVAELISAGAEVNVRGPAKETPLFAATSKGFAEVVAALLEAGAKPDLKDSEGDTPLILAVHARRVDLIEKLVAAGANPSLANREKRSPLSIVDNRSDGETKEELMRALQTEVTKKKAKKPSTKSTKATKKKANAKKRTKPRTKPTKHVLREFDLEAYEYETAIATLNASLAADDFQAAKQRFAEILQGKPAPLGDDPEFGCRVHVVRAADVNLPKLQDEMRSLNAFAFSTGSSFNGSLTVALVPSVDPFLAMAAMQTNGINCGLMPVDVIRWMKDLQEDQPLAIRSVSHDVVEGDFLSPVKEPAVLAQRMYDFCPDIVDQGVGSVEALADVLSDDPPKFYFWWD